MSVASRSRRFDDALAIARRQRVYGLLIGSPVSGSTGGLLRPKLPNFCSVAHSFQLVPGDSVEPSGPSPAPPDIISPKGV